jgi:DNA-binding CsgD family transcriptional regulator
VPPSLQVVSGPPSSFSVWPPGCSIGRSPDCDVVFREPTISRVHARIVCERGLYWVEDVGGKNGLYVDSRKVRRSELRGGEVIQAGALSLRFTLPSSSTATTQRMGSGPSGSSWRRGRELAGDALDRLRLGIVLLRGDGRVVLANRSARAILDGADGLSVGPSGLHSPDAAVARELRGLLAAASDAPPRGGALLISRQSRRPLTVMVTPLSRANRPVGCAGAVVAVFISAPDEAIATGEGLLSSLYGLTPAETRLTGELLKGSSLEEAADQLGISPQTARTHLKHVFAKTATHRQSELLRLLLTGPAQLQAP